MGSGRALKGTPAAVLSALRSRHIAADESTHAHTHRHTHTHTHSHVTEYTAPYIWQCVSKFTLHARRNLSSENLELSPSATFLRLDAPLTLDAISDDEQEPNRAHIPVITEECVPKSEDFEVNEREQTAGLCCFHGICGAQSRGGMYDCI